MNDNDDTLPEPEPNRCPDCGGLRSIYADDCECKATPERPPKFFTDCGALACLYANRHALATALRFLVNPRLRPEDIHAGMTGGGTPAPSNAELLRLADALEGR